MKDSLSNAQKELEQRKHVYDSAKKARKYAKAAYEAELKVFKAKLKSFKQMFKQSILAEQEAKIAYKALRKELKAMEAASEPQIPADLEEPVADIISEKESKKEAKAKTKAAEKATAKPKEKPEMPAKAEKGDDDLTKVKGVGDIVANMLKDNGITTYADMASTSIPRYKELLKANGMSKFRNPTTWAAQAAALAEAPPPAKKAKPAAGQSTKKITEGDDLTKVKGVGDIVANMLKENDITTYADMASTSIPRYKELLKANGMSKFRNPTTWAAQAAALAGVPAPGAKKAASAPAKEADAPVKASTSEASEVVKEAAPAPAAKSDGSESNDDLSRIKGIGDKVIVALNANGIYSYADVAATSVERFKEILNENKMSRFRDPSNWPAQAMELMNEG